MANKFIDLTLLGHFLEKLTGKFADKAATETALGKKADQEKVTQDIVTAKSEAIKDAEGKIDQAKTDLLDGASESGNTLKKLEDKINGAVSDTQWKPSVRTFSEIAKKYPTPQEGWTVSVDDTNEIFRYDAEHQNGEGQGKGAWVNIAKTIGDKIAIASDTQNGLLSKEKHKEIGTTTAQATANKNAITKLNGADSVEGSVKHTVKALETKLRGTGADTETLAQLRKDVNGKAPETHNHVVANITDFDAGVVKVNLTENATVKALSTKLDQHIAGVEAGTTVKVDGKTIVYVNGADEQHKQLAVGTIPEAKVEGLTAKLDTKAEKTAVEANTTAITLLNGEEAIEGSVKHTVKAKIDALNLGNIYAPKSHKHEVADINGLDAHIKGIKVNNATNADSANKVANALSLQIGAEPAVTFDGSGAKTFKIELASTAEIDGLFTPPRQ